MNSAEKSRAAQRRDKKKRKQGQNDQQGPSPSKPTTPVQLSPSVSQEGSSVKKAKNKVPPEGSSSGNKHANGSSKKAKKPRREVTSSNTALPGPSFSTPTAKSTSKVRIVEASSASLEAAMAECAGGPGSNLESLLSDESMTASDRARALLAWLVAPLSVEEFMDQHFESSPLLVRRSATAPHWYTANGIKSASSEEVLLSKAAIVRQVKMQRLTQGEEVTLTRFDPRAKVRRNVHETGKPLLSSYLDTALSEGASVRLLAPQKHHDLLWALMAGLEDNFGAMVGANAYLTPSGEQGFAPHFDDIEAFIMQLEGRKRWRVYGYPTSTSLKAKGDEDMNTRTAAPQVSQLGEEQSEDDDDENQASKYSGEMGPLPRFSSEDFKPEQLPPLLLDTVLEPGDLLFLPRGYVHQAEALTASSSTEKAKEAEQQHSLHVTLSTAQNNAWADLLELLVPQALAASITEDESLRQSLPPDYLSFNGVAHSDLPPVDDDDDDEEEEEEEGDGNKEEKTRASEELALAKARTSFRARLQNHLETVMEQCLELADGAADQMAKRYLSDRLPPSLTPFEEAHTAEGMGASDDSLRRKLLASSSSSSTGGGKAGSKGNSSSSSSSSSSASGGGAQVRMVRPGVARMCIEDGLAVVYHCMENARWHHGASLNPLEFPLDDAPAIDALLNAYPDPISVEDLPHFASQEDLETKAEIVQVLFKEGFLLLVDDKE